MDEIEKIERRKFINSLSFGALGIFFLPLIYATVEFLSPSFRPKKAILPLSLGKPEELFAQKSWLMTKFGSKTVLVMKTGENSFRAVNMRCTHAGCTTSWQADKKKFACNCHGGEFDETGAVTKIPPTKPLEILTIEKRDRGLMLLDKTVSV